MNVLFRVDASLEVGSGHVMRCLTLADALSQRGAQCRFICREHPGHLIALIRQRGHRVTELRTLESPSDQVSTQPLPYPASRCQPDHAHWLGVSQEVDARDTLMAIRDENAVDWLVVDHYALDVQWEQLLRHACRRLMVIDDLADRPHDCDLLLDQNLGRQEADYAAVTPAHAARLIGPGFALLRPEFAQWRSYSLRRRRAIASMKSLLISMGGVDSENVTADVLQAVAASRLPDDTRVTVVMGSKAPWLEQVRHQASRMPQWTEVLCDVANMAQLMSESDLAIGAAGGTAWERCCLGLPSVILVLASNQEAGASALASHRAAVVATTTEQIPQILQQLLCSDANECATLQSLSQASQCLADGQGATRVTNAMHEAIALPTTVRPMTQADLAMVLSWRNDPAVRKYMLTQHEISPSEHSDWYSRVNNDGSRALLIVEEGVQPLGFVQFSNLRPGAAADWGFYAAPDAPKGSGRKLGIAALKYAFHNLGVHKVCGQSLEFNQASVAFHLALGFRKEGVLREQHLVQGQWQAMVCFGLLASEWSSNESPAS